MPLKLTTYYRGSEIPDLPGKNTFHSKELFLIYEATPGYKPVFIVATENGKPIARLLAGIRTNKKLFPPSIVRRCEVYGTGESRMKILTRKPYSAKCWSTSPQKFYETLL
jgi:hypothetical protein